jgi:hypothetical protein
MFAFVLPSCRACVAFAGAGSGVHFCGNGLFLGLRAELINGLLCEARSAQTRQIRTACEASSNTRRACLLKHCMRVNVYVTFTIHTM